MIKTFKRLFVVIGILAAISTLVPTTTAAWAPFDGVNCNAKGASSSAVCQAKTKGTTGNPISGSDGIIMRIADFIAVIAGVAAVIIIIVAGMRFVTSGGSSEGVAGARRAIIYSVVGLIVIVLARSLIGLVLSKL